MPFRSRLHHAGCLRIHANVFPWGIPVWEFIWNEWLPASSPQCTFKSPTYFLSWRRTRTSFTINSPFASATNGYRQCHRDDCAENNVLVLTTLKRLLTLTCNLTWALKTSFTTVEFGNLRAYTFLSNWVWRGLGGAKLNSAFTSFVFSSSRLENQFTSYYFHNLLREFWSGNVLHILF